MKNSRKKPSVINIVGKRKPLTTMSDQEIEKKRLAKVVKARNAVSRQAQIEASLKEIAALERQQKKAEEKIAALASNNTAAPKTIKDENEAMSKGEKNALKGVTYEEDLAEKDIILSVRHLKKFFTLGTGIGKAKLKAVHDVSFDVMKGEIFGLVGESGCGKTTTGRAIIGLHEPTSGSIYFKGYRIAAGNRWNEKEIKWTKKRAARKIKDLKEAERDAISDMPDNDLAEKKNIAQVKEHYEHQIGRIRYQVADTIKVQQAKIRQHDYDTRHVSSRLRTKIQMIFQDPIDSLDPRMTVEEIIEEGLKIEKYAHKEALHLKTLWDDELAVLNQDATLAEPEKAAVRAQLAARYNGLIDAAKNYKKKTADVLTKVGLLPEYASRYPHEFSGGQRQRIGIARALAMNPELIIADEPLSALDVSIRAQIINLLNDLKDEMGLSIIFIAHDLSVVKYFCERIAVMYFGSIVELASSDELFKHPLHPYTKSLLSAIPPPDPLAAKSRNRVKYDPQEEHDYSKQKPDLREVKRGHWVLANDAELATYKKVLK